jgi:N-acetylmuramoyl-L-alanine amidase
MNEELGDVEIVHKPSEDNISTNNPKAEPTCEKKITNVYIAKQKILFVVIEAGDFLGKIASSYEALTADDITDINKLPNPNQLAIGQEIVISSKVHIVQLGDTLGKIAKMSEYAPVDWKEIAKANQLSNPNNIHVGQKLVIPLVRSKHAKLCKEIKYVPKVDTSVGDVVHIVTEVTGFKNGESVTNTIKEDKNIVTQAEETLAVVENDKEKQEIISIIKLDENDPTKGQAVSEPLEVKPKLDVLIYTVKQGDVLGEIVKLYPNVTIEEIVEKNTLKDENSIYVGKKLIIPTNKMKDITSTQEVKDKLNEEPTKSTEIIPIASSPSLPKDDDVEGEVVELNNKCKCKPIIIIDPGHGDNFWYKSKRHPKVCSKTGRVDAGAVARDSKGKEIYVNKKPADMEKDHALIVSKSLKEELSKLECIEKVILTRNSDVTSCVKRFSWRQNKAKDAKATIFISLHLDSSVPGAWGSTVFKGSKANNSKSKNLWKCVDESYSSLKNPKRNSKTKGLTVLTNFVKTNWKKNAGILIELGFISHSDDLKKIKTIPDTIAQEIAKGVEKYVNQYHCK